MKFSRSAAAKKTSITLPSRLEKQLQSQARAENKSLSGLIQDAARFYLNIKQWESLQREMALKGRVMACGARPMSIASSRGTRGQSH